MVEKEENAMFASHTHYTYSTFPTSTIDDTLFSIYNNQWIIMIICIRNSSAAGIRCGTLAWEPKNQQNIRNKKLDPSAGTANAIENLSELNSIRTKQLLSGCTLTYFSFNLIGQAQSQSLFWKQWLSLKLYIYLVRSALKLMQANVPMMMIMLSVWLNNGHMKCLFQFKFQFVTSFSFLRLMARCST